MAGKANQNSRFTAKELHEGLAERGVMVRCSSVRCASGRVIRRQASAVVLTLHRLKHHPKSVGRTKILQTRTERL